MTAGASLDRPVAELSLVTPEARARLADPSLPLGAPPQVPVWDQIAGWAARSPDAVAVRATGGTLTYAALVDQARAVAARLIAGGVAPGTVIAVERDPDPAWVAAVVGVLAAGGVILTIDPALPDERKAVMLRTAAARRLEEVSASAGDRDPALPAVGDRDPAYVFFTSGTTGVPKAVLGTHGGLAHFVAWERDTFAVAPRDRVSLLTSPSFDVVLRDVFLPLTSGATLCLPGPRPRTGAAVFGWLDEEQISVAHLVPSLVWSWLGAGAPRVGLDALRIALFAGEPLRAQLVARWRSAFPRAGQVVNLYGPTETTLATCWYRVPEPPHPGVQPVGRPLPDAQAIVLTSARALCGIGEPGEIAIRTPFRTLGYLNLPDETRRRFVANPFRADPDDLIYLTGDVGRTRPDGTLEVLGRVDDQVKILGVRIEPGEVEAALRAHPAVADAAVVARPGPDGTPRLVAYLAGRDQPPAAGEVRRFLAARLPAAMVPAQIVAVAAIPRLASGKIDRAALPDPGAPAPAAQRAPRTPAELGVAEAWHQILGVAGAGPDDDFYALGGDSLRVLELAAELERRFGVGVGLAALHHASTLAEQATLIDAALDPGAADRPPRDVVAPLDQRRGPGDRLVALTCLAVLVAGIYVLYDTGLRPTVITAARNALVPVSPIVVALGLVLAAGLAAAALAGARRRAALVAVSAAGYALLLGVAAMPLLGYAALLCLFARSRLRLRARLGVAFSVWVAMPVARFAAFPLTWKVETFLVAVIWAQLAYSTIYLLVERRRFPDRPSVVDDLFYLLALPRLVEPFFQPISPRYLRAQECTGPRAGTALRGLALGVYGLGLGALIPHLWLLQLRLGGVPGAAVAMVWFYCLSAGQIFVAVAVFRLLGYDLASGFRWPYASRSFGEFFRRFNHYVRDAVVSVFYLPVLDRLRRTRLSTGVTKLLAGYVAILVGSFVLNSLLVPVVTGFDPLATVREHVTFKRMLLLGVYWTAILLPATGFAELGTEAPPRRARGAVRVARFLLLYGLLWLAAWTLDAQLH